MLFRSDLADFFAEIANDLRGAVEARVHLGSGLLEVLGDGLAEFIEALLDAVHLLLEEQKRLVGLGRLVVLAHYHNDECPDRDEDQQADDNDGGFHDLKLTLARADGNSRVF